MKRGARFIAIASGPIDKGRKKRALLVGLIFRDSYIEGLLSTSIETEGTDSTRKIISMLNKSRFREQVKVLLFNGIALAGLNIIDPKKLERKLKMRVVLLNKRRQHAKELVMALKRFSESTGANVDGRIRIVESSASMNSLKTNGLYLQSTLDKAYLKSFAANAFEALRIAHIIARGISGGESKGRL